MSKLRFGDFTGDGVTDVLAIVGRRWKISESARSQWRNLTPALGDEDASLFIANMDQDDNIDDMLRLEGPLYNRELIWWRSKNGIGPWKEFKRHSFDVGYADVLPYLGFVGRFGVAPGGGTLVIDDDRVGNFFSPAETEAGAPPDWRSVFQYRCRQGAQTERSCTLASATSNIDAVIGGLPDSLSCWNSGPARPQR